VVADGGREVEVVVVVGGSVAATVVVVVDVEAGAIEVAVGREVVGVTGGSVLVVVVDASAWVMAAREGRSVTWSRTIATAWDARNIAKPAAISHPTTIPALRLIMSPVWREAARWMPNGRLRMG
jgi:hypothetical protein